MFHTIIPFFFLSAWWAWMSRNRGCDRMLMWSLFTLSFKHLFSLFVSFFNIQFPLLNCRQMESRQSHKPFIHGGLVEPQKPLETGAVNKTRVTFHLVWQRPFGKTAGPEATSGPFFTWMGRVLHQFHCVFSNSCVQSTICRQNGCCEKHLRRLAIADAGKQSIVF